jgi:rhamnosyltransferase
MSDRLAPKTIAGIVIYFPDFTKLNHLIFTIIAQVDKIIIFNNGGFNQNDLDSLKPYPNIDIVGTGDNLGIGAALNEISRVAHKYYADYLITFDQDSNPSEDLISSLREEIKTLRSSGEKVAAVGPVIVDNRIHASVFPVFQAGTFWINKKYISNQDIKPIPTIQLITSGMLIDLTSLDRIGPFSESYFIDYVDTEWCLRGISKDYKFYICPNIAMYHELSTNAPRRFLGRLILSYPSRRRYYTTRNAIFLIKEKHSPMYIKIYLLLTLIYRFIVYLIIDSPKINLLKALGRGVIDGLTGKTGIYDEK